MKRGPLDASATYFWSSSDKGQLLVPGTERNFDVQRQRIELEGIEINLRTQTPIEGLKLGIVYLVARLSLERFRIDDCPDQDALVAGISADLFDER